MSEFSSVGHSVRKVDSLSISTGNALYTEDYTADHQLYLHMLYSPHPHAIIREIRDEEARHLPGVVDVLHFKNVARVLYTTAGQGFPEPSPYDYCLFDNRVRYVGDRVALVAAESGEAAQKALSLIRVSYEPLPPVLDPEISTLPGAPRIHGDDAYTPLPVTYSPQTNLAAEVELGFGDLEKGFHEADLVEEHTYYSQMASHCAMEPHVSLATFDEKGRLVIITSTQVPFHVRRTVARILDIPTGMIRVIKPRIGGGFGGKQEILLEPYVAYVAWKHKRPARMVLSRKEVFTFARTRHPFRIRLKTGFKKDGTITAFDMDALMNSGAYGTHA
ncbi:MAG TPA: molybdopterin-dependent oxidoreductase, partial [Synergistales bacterium]|nr:molybdopterin-dependent oxidoreductase [Synergistales bacterium]